MINASVAVAHTFGISNASFFFPLMCFCGMKKNGFAGMLFSICFC